MRLYARTSLGNARILPHMMDLVKTSDLGEPSPNWLYKLSPRLDPLAPIDSRTQTTALIPTLDCRR